MKAIFKIGLGIFLGLMLTFVACAALVGGAANEVSKGFDKGWNEAKKADSEKAAFVPENAETSGQENARQSAESYLESSAFSRKGLIGQLKFEGFSAKDASYGAKNAGADWNEQAVKSAKSYLDSSTFSKSGLIGQLKFEGFTPAQAAHGASVAY